MKKLSFLIPANHNRVFDGGVGGLELSQSHDMNWIYTIFEFCFHKLKVTMAIDNKCL